MAEFDNLTGFQFPLQISYLDNDEQAIVHALGDLTPGRKFRILETRGSSLHTPTPCLETSE